MSAAIEIVANALSERFMKSIEASSGTDFAASGVALPSNKTWLEYAKAAIEALDADEREMTKAANSYANQAARMALQLKASQERVAELENELATVELN